MSVEKLTNLYPRLKTKPGYRYTNDKDDELFPVCTDAIGYKDAQFKFRIVNNRQNVRDKVTNESAGRNWLCISPNTAAIAPPGQGKSKTQVLMIVEPTQGQNNDNTNAKSLLHGTAAEGILPSKDSFKTRIE